MLKEFDTLYENGIPTPEQITLWQPGDLLSLRSGLVTLLHKDKKTRYYTVAKFGNNIEVLQEVRSLYKSPQYQGFSVKGGFTFISHSGQKVTWPNPTLTHKVCEMYGVYGHKRL